MHLESPFATQKNLRSLASGPAKLILPKPCALSQHVVERKTGQEAEECLHDATTTRGASVRPAARYGAGAPGPRQWEIFCPGLWSCIIAVVGGCALQTQTCI